MLQDPTFWVAVAFVIVAGALLRPGIRAVTKGLDGRAEKIAAQLNEAEALRVEAQNLLSEYKHKQRDAIEEAERMLEHAKEEVARAQAQGAKDLEQALARRQSAGRGEDRAGRGRGPARRCATRRSISPSRRPPSCSRTSSTTRAPPP